MSSLSSIRIPREAVAVLQRVLDLDEAHADALLSELSTGQSRDLSALKAAIRRAVEDVWQNDDIDSFATHFMSMLALGGAHSFSTNELVKVVTQSIAPVIDKGSLSDEVFSRRLAALLAAPDLVSVSKAIDIITEYDNVLHLSRIISDIRPIFGNDAGSDPIGAVIVHILRIGYFDENRIKTISFALDADDLASLKKVVDRAQEKQVALSRTLELAGLPEFDTTRGADDGQTH